MRRKIFISICLAAVLVSMFAFSGCEAIKGLSNKVPEEYTEGIKYDRDFPDDVLEIYDDAVVFDSKKLFDEIILTFGTQDDMEDVIDFYKDFFEENGITPAEETEDKDEYYARGVFEGYEFKLQISEPDGEYVEDLFECVVYLSARQAKDSDLLKPAVQTTTPAPSEEPTPSPEATATPALTATPTDGGNGETPLSYLEPGSWEMIALLLDGEYANSEATMYFGYDGSGAFYYNDYDTDDRGSQYFSYEAGGGKLDINSDEGNISYQAYFDDGVLHLSNGAGVDMYLANWSENYDVYLSENTFTAYGDWIYYEPETGYIETIAFWPDSTGYIYNWGGNGENHFMNWEYENGSFTIYDDHENEYTYGIVHMGEVFELRQQNGSVFFYNRVSGNYWLTGYFYMEESNDDSVDDLAMTLYYDNTMEYTINGVTEQSYWYIDKTTGKAVITISGYDFYFDYHYDLEGLHLWLPDEQYYYDFVQVG